MKDQQNPEYENVYRSKAQFLQQINCTRGKKGRIRGFKQYINQTACVFLICIRIRITKYTNFFSISSGRLEH